MEKFPGVGAVLVHLTMERDRVNERRGGSDGGGTSGGASGDGGEIASDEPPPRGASPPDFQAQQEDDDGDSLEVEVSDEATDDESPVELDDTVDGPSGWFQPGVSEPALMGGMVYARAPVMVALGA